MEILSPTLGAPAYMPAGQPSVQYSACIRRPAQAVQRQPCSHAWRWCVCAQEAAGP